jgi:hypothetical protein
VRRQRLRRLDAADRRVGIHRVHGKVSGPA